MSDKLEALQQELAGLFDRLASKIFKKPLDVKGIEQLHKVTRRIGFLVIQASERTALDVAKRLNDATGAGFQKSQEVDENLQKQIKGLTDALEEVNKELISVRLTLEGQITVSNNLRDELEGLKNRFDSGPKIVEVSEEQD